MNINVYFIWTPSLWTLWFPLLVYFTCWNKMQQTWGILNDIPWVICLDVIMELFFCDVQSYFKIEETLDIK